MNDELQRVFQMLEKLKKQFDNAIPAAAKGIVESPEMQTIMEISQKAQQTIPMALLRLSELTTPYIELTRQFVEKITPSLLQLAKASARLSVIDRIGKVQYVSWKGFPEGFYEQAYTIQTERELIELLCEWQAENEYVGVDETIKLLCQNEYLKGNYVFEQSVKAYKQKEYDIAALGFTAMIDRLLAVCSEMIDCPSIGRRVKAIKDKVDNSGETVLDDYEMNDFILVTTYFDALALFGEHSDFNGEEPELNRHWIAHGRMNRKIGRIDCVRLINILFGTILMGTFGNAKSDLAK